MRYVYGAEYVNVLPVMTLATDQVVFGGAAIPPAENAAIGTVVTPVAPGAPAAPAATPTWERWLDAGIAHFRVADRAAGKGQWAQADQAFAEAAAAGRVEGWIGRARVALRDGRIDEAASYLRTAAEKHPGQLPWSVAYWSAVIDMQNGQYDRAMDGFRAVSATAFTEAHARGFDFSRDDRVLTDWASACMERARQLREPGDAEKRTALYAEAVALTDRALALDSQRFNRGTSVCRHLKRSVTQRARPTRVPRMNAIDPMTMPVTVPSMPPAPAMRLPITRQNRPPCTTCSAWVRQG
jgi:hypothetical protein